MAVAPQAVGGRCNYFQERTVDIDPAMKTILIFWALAILGVGIWVARFVCLLLNEKIEPRGNAE